MLFMNRDTSQILYCWKYPFTLKILLISEYRFLLGMVLDLFSYTVLSPAYTNVSTTYIAETRTFWEHYANIEHDYVI